jgi:dTDP-4-amino-4,6-dideoxygalactose transaminase
MEIGSEFWISNLPNKLLCNSPSWVSTWGDNILTSSGRGAISLLLEEVEKRNIYKVALLPGYICNSVIEPFLRKGYTCYFYDINNNLEPDCENINRFLKEDLGIFLHMGYYGFPTNDKLSSQIMKFREKGTVVVEDLTHTLFSKHEGSQGSDYYIASLRKWTGIPSGGFLASKGNIEKRIRREQIKFSNLRKEALLLKGDYIKSGSLDLKERYLDKFREGEDILDEDLSCYSIDDISSTILEGLDAEDLRVRRKRNFMVLLQGIKGFKGKGIRPVFDELPDKVCPFFFPIYIENGRDEFKKKLINENIYCAVHWPLPPQLSSLKLPFSKSVYNRIISIPCDQRYDIKDMEKILYVINESVQY